MSEFRLWCNAYSWLILVFLPALILSLTVSAVFVLLISYLTKSWLIALPMLAITVFVVVNIYLGVYFFLFPRWRQFIFSKTAEEKWLELDRLLKKETPRYYKNTRMSRLIYSSPGHVHAESRLSASLNELAQIELIHYDFKTGSKRVYPLERDQYLELIILVGFGNLLVSLIFPDFLTVTATLCFFAILGGLLFLPSLKTWNFKDHQLIMTIDGISWTFPDKRVFSWRDLQYAELHEDKFAGIWLFPFDSPRPFKVPIGHYCTPDINEFWMEVKVFFDRSSVEKISND